MKLLTLAWGYPPDPDLHGVDFAPLRMAVLVGPPGQPGSSGAPLIHVQDVPAPVWVVDHGRGYEPAVTILGDGGVEITGDVRHPSLSQTLISFARPLTGRALLR